MSSQLSLFAGSQWDDDFAIPACAPKISQRQIDDENVAAFIPLIVRFCGYFGLTLKFLDKKGEDNILVTGGVNDVEVYVPFLRWKNVDSGDHGSVHSSKLEEVLFSQVWPGRELPGDYFDTFQPFVFVPKMPDATDDLP